ncbi:uncharacterized protein LY89DRAFT_744973 [Mollisia scopiformis]|uniref:Uncharacterized protein n=1 Tax=Mollisia scopiformis TaxID=149040 RepID=A0A194XV56_MOLSC|nr:uncharacterized protein LY89DRAFT_744973 [Mollisia scopiformis]KUJ24210.1 hypothetical protein LY89DRAFT_744973 [Mollisia scopiformis]
MPSIKERALRLERALTSTPDSKNEDSWMKNTSESTERHRTVTQKSYLNKFKHRRVPAINKSASRSNESTKESSNPLQQRMENSSDKDMVNTDRQGSALRLTWQLLCSRRHANSLKEMFWTKQKAR